MTFEDVLEIKNGKNQRAVENPNGKYPIYGSGGIMGYADDYICNANTVIIGRKGNINKPIFVDEPFWNVDTAFGLEAKRELLLPRYLYYFCLRYDFEHLNKAVTIPSLTKADLLKINIDIPKIDTQTTIVDRLGKIEQIISFRNNQLRLLENLIKARFVELFGDPVSNPKGWEKKALSEEAEIRIGPFGSLLHKEDYIIGGHALINPSHIVNGKITPDDKLTISDEKYDELSAYHLKKGDVVMGRRGEMGRCAVVEQAGLLCGTGSLLIRTNGDLSADYIQKIISFPSFKKTIEEMAVGQTMPNLNVPIVSAFQIIKPPKSVQDQYYAFVAQTDKSKAQVQKSLNETQLLFDSLMQKYFG
jgi:type I restriction enzyme S subunit